jgi:hypothetical protein
MRRRRSDQPSLRPPPCAMIRWAEISYEDLEPAQRLAWERLWARLLQAEPPPTPPTDQVQTRERPPAPHPG